MLVQTHFPQKLSPKRYDQYLASGWFRGSIMLYKMDLLCLESSLYSVINIRMNLEKHENKKRLRRILKKGKENFRIEVGPVYLTEDKERLYNIQKAKFHGFIHKSLHDFLYSGFQNTVFDTYEVCVYDDEKLIAASYFDLGEQSTASLLGTIDPKYSSYSLGILTMLIEVEFSKNNGFKWYYPGYVLKNHSGFDYKLRIGDFEYYNAKKRWCKLTEKGVEEDLISQAEEKYDLLVDLLNKKGISNKKWLYPYFGIGYMNMWDVSFVQLPILIEICKSKEGQTMFLGYDLDAKNYILFWAEHAKGHEHLVNMSLSENMRTNKKFLLNLMRYSNVISRTEDMNRIIKITTDSLDEINF